MAKTLVDKTFLFEKERVPRAVFALVIPTVISQMIMLVYNMSDTFFVGQLGDPDQVAAISLAAPLMLALTALANLFGIGGASVASRALGAKDPDSARRATAFGFYVSLAVAAALSLVALFFNGPLLDMLGASDKVRGYARDYIFWVFVIGGAPSLLSMALAHYIRADGAPKVASIGLSAGGLINLVLDPFFIFDFGLGMGVAGTALTTCIANVCSLLYFLRYIYVSRKDTIIGLRPRWFTVRREISLDVLKIGLPGMLQTLLASVSNAMLNRLATAYGSTVVAALGIVKKVDTIPMSVTIGIAQGVMPLLGFNYTAKNTQRMKDAIKFTLMLSVGFSVLCVALFQLFPAGIVRLFIHDSATITHGVFFLRVMCVATPLMAVGFLMLTFFQAVGESRPALILSVTRKGAVDIPLMLLLNLLFPLTGLAFVQPATELAAVLAAIVLYVRFARKTVAQL